MCDLAAALRELYDVFARVPRPDVIDGCPHCVAPDEGRRLLDEPIRSLTPEALARYAAKAMSTWGGVDDFRYLLPRLLELAADDAFAYPDPEIVFGKLEYGRWLEWPAAERVAIERFLCAWWRDTLASYPTLPSADTVLCSIAATGLDLEPFLAEWAASDGPAAQAQLLELAAGREWRSSYWSGAAAGRLDAWLERLGLG
ncbi:hypothetical protein [Nocardia otitidiscaviarum]|uniref:hypothetical protein n=1 Tax=Nocardia otitidiscaviarum TaxID=1823 RepID=UPI001893467A|nr:hypothetical protein [Nocardia otitidiscaviarum]MBF6176958.1 hypothetical protein [Nocardia otitidiscaviarum]